MNKMLNSYIIKKKNQKESFREELSSIIRNV